MNSHDLEVELVELKRDIIARVLARHGLRLTDAGRDSVSLGMSYDTFRPEGVSTHLAKPASQQRRISLFSRILNWFFRR